ncbi:unnamed protein product [Discula destructiva]
MKLSTLIITFAGFSLAKKVENKRNGAVAANSNSTIVAASNSTDSGNNFLGNGTSFDNGNGLIQKEDGELCINLDALSNVDAQSIDLSGLSLGLLELGSIKLDDQLSLVQGILALMNSFCLFEVFDLGSLLGLKHDDLLEVFLELAQLAQLESFGFLNVFGVQDLIGFNLVFNSHQRDVLKYSGDTREIARIEPALKHTVAQDRRGATKRRQLSASCDLSSIFVVQNLGLCDNGDKNDDYYKYQNGRNNRKGKDDKH